MGNNCLIIFAGLPGSGKTTIAKELAKILNAVYIRIDTIEQPIINSGLLKGSLEGAGYEAAYGVARDNLRHGLTVIADSVNPLQLTRTAWRNVAKDIGVPSIDVEVICSDPVEHRKRVETRTPDIQNHKLPTWAEVQSREYDAWDIKPLTVDTNLLTIGQSVNKIHEKIQRISK